MGISCDDLEMSLMSFLGFILKVSRLVNLSVCIVVCTSYYCWQVVGCLRLRFYIQDVCCEHSQVLYNH